MPMELGRVGIERVEGWGMSVGSTTRVVRPENLDQLRGALEAAGKAGATLAPRGAGCSYGDASTTREGWALDLTRMNRVLTFDQETGVADLEGGATIRQLWRRSLPAGYWPKVVSGTMFPTVGGAAAMNIHGKNNFKVGTFGDNLIEIDLLLANGDLMTCSPTQNADLFYGAVGGFGMLGIITRLKTHTQRVHSGDLKVRGISCHDLGEMMEAMGDLVGIADYLVGWIDTFAGGAAIGRGLLHDARYLAEGEDTDPRETLCLEHQDLPDSVFGVPKAEIWRLLRLFNHDLGMRLINGIKQFSGRMEAMSGWHRQSHAAFNFLLDYVPDWKYAYARRAGEGLLQYQAFLPDASARAGFEELLAEGQARGHTPYLGVLKRHRPDPFLMTHALDGWSLAMDLKVTRRNRESLMETCARFSEICLGAGGRFYFAKDQVISPLVAKASFGDQRIASFRALKAQTDPQGRFSTDLWRRVFEADPARCSHGPWSPEDGLHGRSD